MGHNGLVFYLVEEVGGWMFVCDGDVDRVQVRDQTESCGQRLFQLRLGQRGMFGDSGCRIGLYHVVDHLSFEHHDNCFIHVGM